MKKKGLFLGILAITLVFGVVGCGSTGTVITDPKELAQYKWDINGDSNWLLNGTWARTQNYAEYSYTFSDSRKVSFEVAGSPMSGGEYRYDGRTLQILFSSTGIRHVVTASASINGNTLTVGDFTGMEGTPAQRKAEELNRWPLTGVQFTKQ